ncbi:type II toxin-antitoxin system YafQ family toxin [Paludisphaera sp.]|uniref:type II toxin-antitoxin system YafQ family toxin n=1 Tax=Paludisphaera sp. TaxID=2017432 RepID=UPI00301E560D
MGRKKPTPPGPRVPLTAVLTGRFKRDVEKARRSGRDMSKLTAIMAAIVDREPLDAARRNHPLRGEWKGCHDCHVEGDWVLIYEVDGGKATFHRTGTHSEIFGR